MPSPQEVLDWLSSGPVTIEGYSGNRAYEQTYDAESMTYKWKGVRNDNNAKGPFSFRVFGVNDPERKQGQLWKEDNERGQYYTYGQFSEDGRQAKVLTTNDGSARSAYAYRNDRTSVSVAAATTATSAKYELVTENRGCASYIHMDGGDCESYLSIVPWW